MAQTVNANPEKSFFIGMITRDISLEDAILDLIDNSIDSLIRKEKIDVSATLLQCNSHKPQLSELPIIDLNFSSHELKITDKCGGVDQSSVIHDIFRFGRIAHGKESTLSVYGIGLKRAIFKIGKDIKFESRNTNGGTKQVRKSFVTGKLSMIPL